MSKGLRKGPVNVQDRPRCQALAGLPAFHISIALQLCFKRLDVNWRKLLHRDFANPWHNLARDNLAMSPRSLVQQPSQDDVGLTAPNLTVEGSLKMTALLFAKNETHADELIVDLIRDCAEGGVTVNPEALQLAKLWGINGANVRRTIRRG